MTARTGRRHRERRRGRFIRAEAIETMLALRASAVNEHVPPSGGWRLFPEPVPGTGVNDGECNSGDKKKHGDGKKYGTFQNGADDAEQHAEGQEKHQLAGEAAQGAFIVPFFFLSAHQIITGNQKGAFLHGKNDSKEDENSHYDDRYQKRGIHKAVTDISGVYSLPIPRGRQAASSTLNTYA